MCFQVKLGSQVSVVRNWTGFLGGTLFDPVKGWAKVLPSIAAITALEALQPHFHPLSPTNTLPKSFLPFGCS